MKDFKSCTCFRGGMNTTSCTTGDETPGTSCSCSRRSSYALTDNSDCVCLQCTAGRIAVVTTLKGGVSASAPASRRSSAGAFNTYLSLTFFINFPTPFSKSAKRYKIHDFLSNLTHYRKDKWPEIGSCQIIVSRSYCGRLTKLKA